jgi:hypothetical protein
MKQSHFPPGWDNRRIQNVINFYEAQTEEEAVAEDETALQMEIQDDLRWDELFNKSESKLVAIAQFAKKQIAEGKALPMDYREL